MVEQHGKDKDKDKDRDSKDKDKDKTTILTLIDRQVEQHGDLKVEGAQCDGTALVNLQVKPVSFFDAIIPYYDQIAIWNLGPMKIIIQKYSSGSLDNKLRKID